MKKFASVLVIVFMMVGCAAIQQDTANGNECFESKINPFRLVNEGWKPIGQAKAAIIVKNPNKHQYPKVVAVLVNPFTRLLVAYAYLDGKKLMNYKFNFETKCYKYDELDEATKQWLKEALIKYSGDRMV